MQKLLLFTLLQVSFFQCLSQTQVLKKYDFEKGGYYLLGQRSESDPNTLADSLGDFYTDDIQLLNTIKKEWIFKKNSPAWACGYHYVIHICKKGKTLESFAINLNCNVISTNDGYFVFDAKKLRKFKAKLKPAFSEKKKFSNISEARAYYKNTLTTPLHLLTLTPQWQSYEGTFRFDYIFKKTDTKYRDNNDQLLKKLTAELMNTYPNEFFNLNDAGGSSTEAFIEVTCNKSLSDKFTLYKKETYFDWQPFDLNLTSFWKNRH